MQLAVVAGARRRRVVPRYFTYPGLQALCATVFCSRVTLADGGATSRFLCWACSANRTTRPRRPVINQTIP